MNEVSDGIDTFPSHMEYLPLPENDRIFEILKATVTNYKGRYLIGGGLGVLGVLGREMRVTHDFDICVPVEEESIAKEFYQKQGFVELTHVRHHAGNAILLRRPRDGLIVDLFLAEFLDGGIKLTGPGGYLFIPLEGINYTVVLRGISFMTFTPEVAYLIKNRATRRSPLMSVVPYNRPQDEADYQQLRMIIDIDKAKSLLDHGFAYKGRHPLPIIVRHMLGDWFRSKRPIK